MSFLFGSGKTYDGGAAAAAQAQASALQQQVQQIQQQNQQLQERMTSEQANQLKTQQDAQAQAATAAAEAKLAQEAEAAQQAKQGAAAQTTGGGAFDFNQIQRNAVLALNNSPGFSQDFDSMLKKSQNPYANQNVAPGNSNAVNNNFNYGATGGIRFS